MSDMEDLDPEGRLLAKIAEHCQAEEAMAARTDVELAALLDEYSGEVDMFSPTAVLAASIIGRLRRARGGPYHECDWCTEQASVTRPDGLHACSAHEGASR